MYQHIVRFTVHVRFLFNEKKKCKLFNASTDLIVTKKYYIRKEIVMMKSSIVDFRQQLYITEIHKLAVQLLHVNIPVTHHCGKTRQGDINDRAA